MNTQLLVNDIKKLPRQFLGYLIIAIGITTIKTMDLGMNPWGTLQLGITKLTGIQFGTAAQLVGLIVIILSCFFKIYPGIGTILNMIFIGYFVNCIDYLKIIPCPDFVIFRILLLLIGQLLMCYGIYVYLSCGIGAGPRDGLMVGLVKTTGKSVTLIRTSIEASVFVLGVILGGKIGIGTVIVTFSGGWILNKVFNIKNYNPKKEKHSIITDYIKNKSSC